MKALKKDYSTIQAFLIMLAIAVLYALATGKI